MKPAAHLGRGHRRPRSHACHAGVGFQTGAGERGQGPLTRLQPPTPHRRAAPASAPQPVLCGEGLKGLRGQRLGLPFPHPQIKGSRRPGHRPLATPSPIRRMVGAARRIQAKPVGGAAWTRALGITASWGLRISRPRDHAGLGPAPPTPAAGSVLSNADVRRDGPKRPQPHWGRTMAAAAGQRRKCACARGGSLPQLPGSGRLHFPEASACGSHRGSLGGLFATFGPLWWGRQCGLGTRASVFSNNSH